MARRWTLGEQLGQTRLRRFVGRRAELDLFAAALSVPEPPFTVLHVHGPGGVGKSALLHCFAELASDAGVLPVRLDARYCEPTPGGVLAGLRRALDLPEDGSPVEALAQRGPAVLLIDTYECALAADDWLRDELLPGLPAGTLIVLAGREPPTPGWRADPGWSELLRVISLRNLPPQDSLAFLRAAGVPEDVHADALACSHGHPLALTLLVDVLGQQGPGSPTVVDLAGDPNVVRVLVERFTATAPSPRHQQALEACALVRAITESVLRIALETDDAGELFMWLRSLSFVEDSAHGLTLHDLARDVLDADLRWRDPTRYEDLRHRLHQHVATQIQDSAGELQQRLMLDAVFLHRMSPAVRVAYDWDGMDQVRVQPAAAGDRAGILAMVRRHEGAEAAGWAEFWLDRHPVVFSAFRGAGGALLGFCCYLRLHDVAAADRDADPATRAAWTFVQRRGPARAGEHVTFLRFIMDAEVYQRPSPAFNLRAAVTMRNWVGNPRLAWDILVAQDPYPLHEELAYLDYDRAPEADFTIEGRRFTAYAHDWRRRPADEWVKLMDQRGAHRTVVTPESGADDVVLVLSQPEFEESVRAALREVSRPALLAGNPLCRSRLVRRFATGVGSPEALASAVRAAVEALRGDARDVKLYHALDRTYLRPAPTQERAAEVLGLVASRALLEGHVRQRVRALPAIQMLDGCDAAGLEVSADGRRVTGLRVLPRTDGAAAQVLDADLVVDASGRGSRTPVWLEQLGYPRPSRDEVRVGVAYASRRYRIEPEVLRDEGGVGISNGTLPRPSGGGLQFVEHGQMVVTVGGYAGNHPPVDPEGFAAFAARLPAGLREIIQQGEPVGDPIRFTFPASVRNRYERLCTRRQRRFPDGLLVVGDAVCSFNPLHGQGMSVAALEALALRECLRGGTHRLAPRFFRAATKIVNRAWEISVTGDLRLPEVVGRRTLTVRLINAYLPHLHAAATVDSRVGTAFLRVSNLLDAPPRLVSPVLMWRVLRANLRRRGVPHALDLGAVPSPVSNSAPG